MKKKSLYYVINTLNKNNLSLIEVLDENISKDYRVNTNKYNVILNKANTEVELKNKVNNII